VNVIELIVRDLLHLHVFYIVFHESKHSFLLLSIIWHDFL